MKSDWFVSPSALSRARQENLLSQQQLATKSGASLRSIQGYERAERPVRLDTLTCIAQALSVEVKDIATLRTAGSETRGKKDRAPSPAAPKSHEPASPPPFTALPPRTALETLVDLERAAGVAPASFETARGPAEELTVKRLQDVFTAYVLHEGGRFRIVGRVQAMRGIAHAEALLLGSRNGVAARFNIVKEVAPGQPVSVTIHAGAKEHTATLQAHYEKDVAVIVRVVLVPGEPRDGGPGFSSFFSRNGTARPWTFVVEEVAPADAAAEMSATKTSAVGKQKRAR